MRGTRGITAIFPHPSHWERIQSRGSTPFSVSTVALYHGERRVRRFFQLPLYQRRMMSVEGERRRLGVTHWAGDGYGGIARYDVVPTVEGGWQVLEWNTNVCGGHPECLGLAALLDEECPEARNPSLFIDRLAQGIATDGAMSTPTLGVLYATGYAEDAQVACVLRELLRRRGIRVLIGAPTNLTFARDGSAYLFGERVGVIYNYFPTCWFDQLPRRWLQRFLGAYLQAGFELMTPLDQLMIQNKKISAFWHAYRTWFTTAEQALIQRYVPYTRCFQVRQGRSYMQEREAIVLKKIEGRQGEEVLVGRLIPPEEWTEAVAAIAGREPGAWTVQDAVDIRPVQFPHPQTGRWEWMFPCINRPSSAFLASLRSPIMPSPCIQTRWRKLSVRRIISADCSTACRRRIATRWRCLWMYRVWRRWHGAPFLAVNCVCNPS